MYGRDVLGGNPAWWNMGRLDAGGSTLLNGLVSYWPLNETSGTRYDAVGDNDLTDNNTVLYVPTGPKGTVAKFTAANSESLSASATVDTTQNVTLIGWMKGATSATQYIFGQGSDGANTDFDMYVSVNNAIFRLGNGSAKVQATISVPSAEWKMFAMQWRTASAKVRIQAFGSGAAGAWVESAALTGSPANAGNLYLGSGGVGTSPFCDGNLAGWGLWNIELSDADILSIFNSGNGKKYADLTAAEKVDLVSYWNLDEVSGTRNDSHGTNHLTDNNTVLAVNRGPSGTVASFVAANSEYLTTASATANWAQAFSVAFWFNHAVVASYNGLFAGGTDKVRAYFNPSTEALVAQIFGTMLNQPVNSITVPTGWHLGVVTFDGVNAGLLYIDGVTEGPEAITVGVSASGFTVGATNGPTNYFNGNESSVGVWQRELSAADVVALFNSGNGKKYADLTAGEKTGLVSYWNLDEASGTRVDSHGTNHLTDNNTVDSVVNSGSAMDGAAASFVAANSESLSKADPFAFTSFTLSAWVRPTASGGYYMIATKDDTTGNREWTIQRDADNQGHLYVFGASATSGSATGGVLAQDAWSHIMVWFDESDGKGRIQINGGPVVATAAITTPLRDTGAAFNLGIRQDGYGWQGQIDEVAIWSRVLTEDERTELYNAGAGKFYPTFT